MKTSESIKQIAAALVKAQANFPAIPRTKTAEIRGDKANYSFKYAPLEDILERVRPVLLAEGIALLQGVEGFSLVTTLLHESGEFISHAMELPHAYPSSRAYGSELTYKRRNSVTAVLGLATEEDDDGQHAERALAAEERKKIARASASAFNKECFESLEPKHQEHIRQLAANVVALLDEERDTDAYLYIEEQKLDDAEKPALWWLLNSGQRSSIKAASSKFNNEKKSTRAEQKSAH